MPGPAQGSRCRVCNHPGIALINAQVNQGIGDGRIGTAFGFDRNRIRYHRTNRHPGVSEAAATKGTAGIPPPSDMPEGDGRPEVPPPASDDPRVQLDWLVTQLRSQAEDGDIRADVARELRLALETQAKLGSNEPPPVVQVKDVDGLALMLRDMHEALKPWPEAREAMAAVWRRHRAPVEEADGDPEPEA